MRVEGEKVYYNDGLGEQVLYDFGMEVGDSLEWTRLEECYRGTFILDSIYTHNLEGESIRVQQGRIETDLSIFDGTFRIYEGIGFTEKILINDEWSIFGFLLPHRALSCALDSHTPFLCSFDNGIVSIDNNCRALSPDFFNWEAHSYFWKLTYGAMNSPQVGHRILRFEKDTIINQLTYNNIENTSEVLQGIEDTVRFLHDEYYLRTELGKVFYWDGEQDQLIYNFSMRIGDTIVWRPKEIDINPTENCYAYFVLDNLTYIYGIFERQIIQIGTLYEPYWETETKVRIDEGVGLSHFYNTFTEEWEIWGHLIPDLILQCFFDGEDEGRLCYYRGILRSLGDEEDCADLVSEVNIPEIENQYSIYPNPSEERIFIEGNLSAIKAITILDLFGNTMMHLKAQHQVNIQDLSPGIYLIMLSSEKGIEQIQKIVKI